MALELKGTNFWGGGEDRSVQTEILLLLTDIHTQTHRSCYFIIRIIIGKLYLGFREKEEKAKASKFYQARHTISHDISIHHFEVNK